VIQQNVGEGHEAADETGGMRAPITTRVENPHEEVIAAEAQKGYGFLVIGREPASEGPVFHEQITASAAEFAGPFSIVIARGIDRAETVGSKLNILVPVTGTATSRHGAEMAIALAHASDASLTALHFSLRSRRPALAPGSGR
jgi:hypothetical protein